MPVDAKSNDPFTRVLARLWDVLLAGTSALPSLVEPNNRVVLAGLEPAKFKRSVNPGDVPELGIFPIPGGSANMQSSSKSTIVVQNFSIELTSRSLVLDLRYFPIKWEIIRALVIAGDDLGIDDIVNNVSIVDVSDERTEPQSRAGVGWSAVFVVSVRMMFQTELIKNGTYSYNSD